MLNFPEYVLQCMDTLRHEYNHRKSCLIITFPIMEIVKYEKEERGSEREISIKLFFDYKTETFEIQAPTYKYYSRISHYDYNKTERRWLRNKDYLFSLIRNLKNCGLWEMVSNQDFIVVNNFNKKINSERVLKILEGVKAL